MRGEGEHAPASLSDLAVSGSAHARLQWSAMYALYCSDPHNLQRSNSPSREERAHTMHPSREVNGYRKGGRAGRRAGKRMPAAAELLESERSEGGSEGGRS